MPLALAVLPAIALGQNAAAPGYHLVKKVKLGGAGSWDYFDVDPGTHRIFIPRTSHLMVVDPSGQVAGDIAHLEGAHAVAFAPTLNLGFTANDSGQSVTTFDLGTLKVLRETKIGNRSPDAILYEPVTRRVFTMNGDLGHDATAIDASSGKVVGTLPLGGKPETARPDGTGHLYINIQDKSQLLEVDARSLTILHTWPLAPCQEPAGLAIDPSRNRLFVGCRNQVMALVDYTNGKVLDSVPIGWLVDANQFDPQTGLAFASTYDGKITAAREGTPGKFEVVQTIETQTGARTMALDPSNHNLYAVTADLGVLPPPSPKNLHPRAAPLPGTFTLLIFSQQE